MTCLFGRHVQYSAWKRRRGSLNATKKQAEQLKTRHNKLVSAEEIGCFFFFFEKKPFEMRAIQ